MTPDTNSYQEFVERHVRLLNALSDALDSGRAAIVSFRIQDFEECIGEQKRLCVEIAALNNEIRRAFPLAHLIQESARVPVDLPELLHKARTRLQKLNREQQSLVLRSRRTVNAMLNGFRSFEGSYAAEALQQTAGGASLQERA